MSNLDADLPSSILERAVLIQVAVKRAAVNRPCRKALGIYIIIFSKTAEQLGMMLRDVSSKPLGIYWPLAILASAAFDISPFLMASTEEVSADGHPQASGEVQGSRFIFHLGTFY